MYFSVIINTTTWLLLIDLTSLFCKANELQLQSGPALTTIIHVGDSSKSNTDNDEGYLTEWLKKYVTIIVCTKKATKKQYSSTNESNRQRTCNQMSITSQTFKKNISFNLYIQTLSNLYTVTDLL